MSGTIGVTDAQARTIRRMRERLGHPFDSNVLTDALNLLGACMQAHDEGFSQIEFTNPRTGERRTPPIRLRLVSY